MSYIFSAQVVQLTGSMSSTRARQREELTTVKQNVTNSVTVLQASDPNISITARLKLFLVGRTRAPGQE